MIAFEDGTRRAVKAYKKRAPEKVEQIASASVYETAKVRSSSRWSNNASRIVSRTASAALRKTIGGWTEEYSGNPRAASLRSPGPRPRSQRKPPPPTSLFAPPRRAIDLDAQKISHLFGYLTYLATKGW